MQSNSNRPTARDEDLSNHGRVAERGGSGTARPRRPIWNRDAIARLPEAAWLGRLMDTLIFPSSALRGPENKVILGDLQERIAFFVSWAHKVELVVGANGNQFHSLDDPSADLMRDGNPVLHYLGREGAIGPQQPVTCIASLSSTPAPDQSCVDGFLIAHAAGMAQRCGSPRQQTATMQRRKYAQISTAWRTQSVGGGSVKPPSSVVRLFSRAALLESGA